MCALSKGRHVSFMVSLVAPPASQTAPSTCGKCVVPNMTSSGLLCVSIVPRFPLHGLCCVLLSVQTTTPTRSRMRVTFGDGVDVRVPMHSPASVWHVTCSVFVTCDFQHLKIVTESVVSVTTNLHRVICGGLLSVLLRSALAPARGAYELDCRALPHRRILPLYRR